MVIHRRCCAAAWCNEGAAVVAPVVMLVMLEGCPSATTAAATSLLEVVVARDVRRAGRRPTVFMCRANCRNMVWGYGRGGVPKAECWLVR